MKTLKPQKLKNGMTIGLLSVSGAVEDKSKLEISKQRLEKSGYKVILSKNKNYRNMAGTKEECIKNIYKFFSDPKIDIIIASRGGYGTLRFLKDIDYSIIKKNPKIFIGFSDITNLLAMFYKKAGLIGFYGPMALSDFSTNFDKTSYYKMIETLSDMPMEFCADIGETLYKGKAKGILWGGNLSSLASMCGLDFIPNEDFILFFEDWHDPVYKLDRMFTQLMNIDKFKKNLKGIIWGEFLGVNEDEFSQWQNELIKTLKLPMAQGFKITHGENKLTLPFGIKATFDADKRTIKIDEEYLK
ncbi:LD-carboxypeptidase [bacterium]|nr:LD-carboxypeptidase [bacterium]